MWYPLNPPLVDLYGQLPLLTLSFIQDHYLHVCLSSVLSVHYPQETGVPQGLILSVTLFAIAINGVEEVVGPSVLALPYLDDVTTECSLQVTRTICHTGL
jgi:hypothetical protein